MPPDEAERVAEHCRQVLYLKDLTTGTEYAYPDLPLCVIDAVYSIGVRYESVKNVVARYRAYYSVEDMFTFDPADVSPARAAPHTIRDFVANLEREGVERFATQIFQNRQRTSTRGGILKAEAVYRFASALQKYDVHLLEDVPTLRDNRRFEQDIFAIPGQRSGVSLRYFYMLCGAQELVKPDRMILRFLESIVKKPVGIDRAQALLAEACHVLEPEHPGLTPRALDNAIWQYQRAIRANPNAPVSP